MKRGAKASAPGDLMTIQEYAVHRGVSRTAVIKAIEAGRIRTHTASPRGSRKTIDAAEADSMWDDNTDTTKPMNTVKRKSPTVLNFNAARARHETFKARKAQLEFEQMRGKLIDADEVRKRWFTICRRTRDRLMSVPDRVVPLIAGMADSAEMHRLVAAEIRQALEEMSGDDS